MNVRLRSFAGVQELACDSRRQRFVRRALSSKTSAKRAYSTLSQCNHICHIQPNLYIDHDPACDNFSGVFLMLKCFTGFFREQPWLVCTSAEPLVLFHRQPQIWPSNRGPRCCTGNDREDANIRREPGVLPAEPRGCSCRWWWS